jgi:hypothetical protein
MSVSLSFKGKKYFFNKKGLVDKIYDEYVNKGYDVKKMTLKNGGDENSAILIRGEYDTDNLFQPHMTHLLNKDFIGARTGGNSKPQFLLKDKNNNFTYGFINLNQIITFKYKYQVIETWGGPVSSGNRTKYTTTKLTFTSWESAFPLETNLICSFGKNSFTLRAGYSTGDYNSDPSFSSTYDKYSEDDPQGGLYCTIIAEVDDGTDITCSGITNDNWDTNVPESIRDKLAIRNPDEWHEMDWHGPIWWTGESYRIFSVTYLDAKTKKWETLENDDYNTTDRWYFYPDYPSWSSLPVDTFKVPGGMALVGEDRTFNKTYIYRAVRGDYATGSASEEYYSYTYRVTQGSETDENEISFSFTYEGNS